MGELTCSDCIHIDVCENRFSWLDQEDNTKYIICHHFKNKADVVEVVRCKDCAFAKKNYLVNGICLCEKTIFDVVKGEIPRNTLTDENDFCSYGEREE